MKAEIGRIISLLPLMLLSMVLLSLLVRGSGVLAYRSFQSPPSPVSPPPTVPPSPTATAIPLTETPIFTPTETPATTETPTPIPTETPAPTETPLPSPTPTFEAEPSATVASPTPPIEESPTQPSRPGRSLTDYMAIGLVALAYTWRALGAIAFVAFLGLVIFLAVGRWRR